MDRLKLMETYTAVVKLGSYTRAAKELGVTRAMVSKRIQDLEGALAVKLLNRDTHRLSPTMTGLDYYENCVTLLAEMHALDERMQAKRAVLRGELKILSSKTFSETMLGPIVAEFCRVHPGISVHITLRDRGAPIAGPPSNVLALLDLGIASRIDGQHDAHGNSVHIRVALPEQIGRAHV